MIRSMTGYGRGEFETNCRKFTVEIKSVNHKYNDFSVKLPRSLFYLEDEIRKYLSSRIKRGKTDIYISFETFSKDDIEITVNEVLAEMLVEKLNFLKEKYNLSSNETLSLVTKFPDVLTVEKKNEDEDEIRKSMFQAIDIALESFVKMREKEGENLKNDILEKVNVIEDTVKNITLLSEVVVEEYKNKLETRINELLQKYEIDEQRLATEVAIVADKCCIDEEITRLKSHIIQMREILHNGGQIGRKLDFVVQEMNRESNTIASKSNDIRITNYSITLKSEIEKIREQIQNIE